jgi:hypothetical protein
MQAVQVQWTLLKIMHTLNILVVQVLPAGGGQTARGGGALGRIAVGMGACSIWMIRSPDPPGTLIAHLFLLHTVTAQVCHPAGWCHLDSFCHKNH